MVRHILTAGFLLLAIVVLPASMAVAQSQYLEGIDLAYRSYSQVAADTEERLVGDFLNTVLRLDAGVLEEHTIAGAYAPEVGGTPEGEANGFYAAYHSGGIEVDALSAGYEADIKGGAVGYERWYHNTLYALNLASTKTETDFTGTGFDGRSEDQEMLSIGVHSMGIYFDDWTMRGRISGFMTESDHEGVEGAAEAVEYECSGINAGAMIGYLFKLGSFGTVLPEIGGEYLYAQRDGFTTEIESPDSDVSIRHFHGNHVTGKASLRWTNRLRLLNIDLVPSVGVGFQKLIADDVIAEEQAAGDVSTVIEKELETVTKTVSASLMINAAKHLQATLSYNGGFGDDVDQHLLSFRLRIPF